MKVDRIFAQMTNASLLAKLDTPTPSRSAAQRAVSQPERDRETKAAPAALLSEDIIHALDLVLGGSITVEGVLELGELAAVARSAQAGRGAIEARLNTYESQVAGLRGDLREVSRRLEDTQLDAAVAEEGYAKAAAEVRRLQKLLIVTDQAARIWVPDEESTERRPVAYEELADRLEEWSNVSFTGEVDKLLELDQYDESGGWAGKIWDIFGALNDYAQAILEQKFTGGVHLYLTDTPPGCRSYSATRHAPDESEDVTNNPYYRLRMLPVPLDVSPDGEVFMGAHFKIAQYGMISPRLHYYNDVRATGRVYVGYIGKHLRTSRTN
ncbi:hypothetical protein GCM10017786_37870 [Amycolatopsis deserti]|uniref:Uncharacterized protein n=2 Tax=Amycolatopsis deserti TaxID=185696 RepID=A0ABQ3J3D2_9PSEU|nr:hypothetical protein GCM10017786_37870 [Amycolatopsis deserti]